LGSSLCEYTSMVYIFSSANCFTTKDTILYEDRREHKEHEED
jgi:hypothetical protein